MSNLCIGTCLLAPNVATPMRQRNDQKKKDKQRSTKHAHKTKDPVTRTQLHRNLFPLPQTIISKIMGKSIKLLHSKSG